MYRLGFVRVLPVALLLLATAFWMSDVQDHRQYLLRNIVPLALVLALSLVTLWRGGGRWTGSGYRWPLATLGFAVPAVGLSLYLHYAYQVNLNEMFTGSASPMQLFRFLPWYTTVAGAVGFAIGWIAGRNL